VTTRNIRQIFIAVALAATTISVARAEDDESKECSAATLRGLYVFAASGFNIGTDGVASPKAIVEEIHFDGEGNVTVPAVRVSRDGVLFPPQHPAPGSNGTYHVNPNCTGTLAFFDGPTFDLFIAPSSSHFQIIQTNPGSVLQGTVVRVRRD
jgi:hypothetical protein